MCFYARHLFPFLCTPFRLDTQLRNFKPHRLVSVFRTSSAKRVCIRRNYFAQMRTLFSRYLFRRYNNFYPVPISSISRSSTTENGHLKNRVVGENRIPICDLSRERLKVFRFMKLIDDPTFYTNMLQFF